MIKLSSAVICHLKSVKMKLANCNNGLLDDYVASTSLKHHDVSKRIRHIVGEVECCMREEIVESMLIRHL